MAHVFIENPVERVGHEIENTFEAVRIRAFELFQERGGMPGHELEDWLQAERELLGVPEAAMTAVVPVGIQSLAPLEAKKPEEQLYANAAAA